MRVIKASSTSPAGLLIAAVAVAVTVTAAGCGESSGRGDKQRPPLPIVIAIQIGKNEFTASPSKIGAGPFTLTASNQTKLPQILTIKGPRVKRSIPVDANDTSTLKITLEPGDYTLS